MTESTIRLAADALIVLAGPSGAGKSTWATKWFRSSQIVSSDSLRGVVGEHEHDLRASADAFALLDQIVERRLGRGLLTVIDTLGMDRDRLDRWLAIAAEHGRSTHLVRFDEDAATCRKRNRSRPTPVPAKALTAQLEKWVSAREEIALGFDAVHEPTAATVVSSALLPRAATENARLRFGLSISSFDWPGKSENIADRLQAIAGEAEQAGFDSIWVMDHFMQIPQVGRDWEPMLEAYTALSWLAANTTRVRLGALVTCVTHRNLGHLGKILATLDVLSAGRAMCGLGTGWFEKEHAAFGYDFPPLSERYELLEDALEFLPLQWGAGAPRFDGRRFSTPEARGYPRPVQERIPMLVGGSGEKRTLLLAAQHGDACNIFGEPDVVAHKVEVLHRHCAELNRDPAAVEVTQLSAILAAANPADLTSRVNEVRPSSVSAEQFIERANAGTVDAHIDRFTRLANAGVQTAIVSLADVGYEGAVAGFAPIIEAFSA